MLSDVPTEGKADVKVVSLPQEVIDQLLDDESTLELDDEDNDEDTVKLVLKFADSQQLLAGGLASLFNSILVILLLL